MDITNSASVNNSVKLRSILIAGVVYLIAAILTVGLALLVLLVVGLFANWVCKREIVAAGADSNRFKKRFPFAYFGEVFGNFEHTFYHEQNLQRPILEAVDRELKTRTPVTTIVPVTIIDTDDDLTAPESQNFIRADGGNTKRGTNLTLVMRFADYGKMQSIRWWVLAGGYIDKEKKFNFIVYSPFTVLFWIFPYFKKEYNVLGRIRTIYGASYNDMQITTEIRCLHDVVFTAMADELQKNGVDTSDLRVQRMQVMNLSISGGKVAIGNIVQGAGNIMENTMNKLAGGASGSAQS